MGFQVSPFHRWVALCREELHGPHPLSVAPRPCSLLSVLGAETRVTREVGGTLACTDPHSRATQLEEASGASQAPGDSTQPRAEVRRCVVSLSPPNRCEDPQPVPFPVSCLMQIVFHFLILRRETYLGRWMRGAINLQALDSDWCY